MRERERRGKRRKERDQQREWAAISEVGDTEEGEETERERKKRERLRGRGRKPRDRESVEEGLWFEERDNGDVLLGPDEKDRCVEEEEKKMKKGKELGDRIQIPDWFPRIMALEGDKLIVAVDALLKKLL
ncbi:hypothetical protein RJT34_01702 [Clitoria ternatea]|uniref:Uncharacterized protein n=1 Tax=Clitoria ternatea TaxID=43366 RepID=A0AAN9PZZ1_CLITE